MDRLPSWFKQDISRFSKTAGFLGYFRGFRVNTVCLEAKCPNQGDCFSEKTATFLILGSSCTRACKFCAVKKANRKDALPLDKNEPRRVAKLIHKLKMDYVVITSVTRDDLPDKGSGHFVKTVDEIKSLNPRIKAELLIPDFLLDLESLKVIAESDSVCIGHNIETVKRLYPALRPRSCYQRSLNVLRYLKRFNKSVVTKTAMMLGLGESEKEMLETFSDLRKTKCDILYLGQYLRPSKKEAAVKNFVAPEEFLRYKDIAEKLGFRSVFSGPLVRSSYKAKEAFKDVNSYGKI